MKGIYLGQHSENQERQSQVLLSCERVRKKARTADVVTVCAPGAGLLVLSCHRSSLPPNRHSSPGRLLRTRSRCQYVSVPTPCPPPPTKRPRRPYPRVLIRKTDTFAQGEFNPVSSPLVNAQSPSPFVAESSLPPAQLDCSLASLVVAPTSAHGRHI